MIPQIEPWLGEEEIRQLKEVIHSNWLTEGSKTETFEQRFAILTETRFAIAVNNATAGLFICLKALGIGEGDEVILPDLTFIATANAVIWAGAQPILADVDATTFNMDPDAVAKRITTRTRAILPVHLYGQAADMGTILRMAGEHNVSVIEDAAESVGTRYQHRPVGGWGDVGVFSFYGNKTLTTGQGGMITTNDEDIAGNCVILKNHGRTKKSTFVHDHIGYNFCFTDLQAAVGLAQLDKFDQILQRKRRNLELYQEFLKEVPQVHFPAGEWKNESVPWFTNILVDDPEALRQYLQGMDIGTRRFFLPLHRQPCYQGKWLDAFPNADRMYQRGLSLPSAATLTEDEVALVSESIRDFYLNEKK